MNLRETVVSILLVLLLFVVLSSRRTNFLDIPTTTSKFSSYIKQPSISPCDCSTTTSVPASQTNRVEDDYNNDACCERIIWRTHKFGTILLGDMFQAYRPRHNRSPSSQQSPHTHNSNNNMLIQTQPTPKSPNYTLPTQQDYRHIMVTRNWFDAIVSGYLYHKAGYECWIEPRGVSRRHSKHYDMQVEYHNKNWDTQQLWYHSTYNISFPPRNNRSLCQYLQDEPAETTGIPIIIDIALSRWYKGVVSYHTKVMEREQQQQPTAVGNEEDAKNPLSSLPAPRTLFLCYEDLVDPFQQEHLFHVMLHHLFPATTTSNATLPPALAHALAEQQRHHSVYSGGHSSLKNATARARLRQLVQYYDAQLFAGRVAQSNAVLGCGGS